jgi:hypothetical protein
MSKPALLAMMLLTLLALGTAEPPEDALAVPAAAPEVGPQGEADLDGAAPVDAAATAAGADRGAADLPGGVPSGEAFTAQRSGFALRIRRDVTPYSLFALFALPGEKVPLSLVLPGAGVKIDFEASAGSLHAAGPTSWTWDAPAAPGVHRLRFVEAATKREILLNAFVMHRLEPGAEKVGGYLLGKYPQTPATRAGNAGPNAGAYQPPRGFVEVTAANRDVLVSPHFTLGQFVCKQGTGWPKFVALREPLLLKLEALLEAANQRGWKARTFHVMSGYRTPAYNKGLQNVGLSRHLYGDAADVFIDDDGNGAMDDLNRDGRVDRADAVALHDLFAEVEATPSLAPYIGGLGIYPATAAHGPYVHVDARGFRARWGE